MRRFVELVFDDYIRGLAIVYNSSRYDTLLAACDILVLHAVADRIAGASPRINVQLEHSGDGIHWREKGVIPQIDSQDLDAGTNSFVGADSGVEPSLGFVRFAIRLEGTNPRAHVKLWICGRDRAEEAHSSCCPEQPGQRSRPMRQRPNAPAHEDLYAATEADVPGLRVLAESDPAMAPAVAHVLARSGIETSWARELTLRSLYSVVEADISGFGVLVASDPAMAPAVAHVLARSCNGRF